MSKQYVSFVTDVLSFLHLGGTSAALTAHPTEESAGTFSRVKNRHVRTKFLIIGVRIRGKQCSERKSSDVSQISQLFSTATVHATVDDSAQLKCI